ncbi:hypothetical protein V8G54_019213 [Vigna mungo]|uniref:Uncharacterized protein n=1 Tax=Vigna mungo TaxID=3915 RepID=A0AAQ3RTI3_VIGMU
MVRRADALVESKEDAKFFKLIVYKKDEQDFFYAYSYLFNDLLLCFPSNDLHMGVMRELNLAFTQLHPNGWAFMQAFKEKGRWLFTLFVATFKGFKTNYIKAKFYGEVHWPKLPFYWIETIVTSVELDKINTINHLPSHLSFQSTSTDIFAKIVVQQKVVVKAYLAQNQLSCRLQQSVLLLWRKRESRPFLNLIRGRRGRGNLIMRSLLPLRSGATGRLRLLFSGKGETSFDLASDDRGWIKEMFHQEALDATLEDDLLKEKDTLSPEVEELSFNVIKHISDRKLVSIHASCKELETEPHIEVMDEEVDEGQEATKEEVVKDQAEEDK